MKKNTSFICLLADILDCAEKEKNIILDGKMSQWSLEQIQKVLSYANNGKICFKYGKKLQICNPR